MGFVKVLKNKAYSKRYQTKFRRRRQGKTDYYARKRMVVQDKNKYDNKKYRLVVRRTNRRIICSVNYSTLTGDRCMAMADSLELKSHGLTCGLTNDSAAYCTGLLVARRLLESKKMHDMFQGQKVVDGAHYDVFAEFEKAGGESRKPFKCYLDIGLVRTSTGNRVFGALKGACDGGLHVPDNTKRFPGTHVEKADATKNKRGKVEEKAKGAQTFDPKEHKEHIFGGHVEKYFNLLKKENPTKFKLQFSNWDKAVTASKVKDFAALYTAVHASIRKAPARVAAAKKSPVRKVVQPKPALIQTDSKGRKWLRQKKITLAARKERSVKKLAALLSRD